MAIHFNETEQKKKMQQLRDADEENVSQMLSKKYGIPYIDLSGVSIDTDALKLIEETTAREFEVAGFDLVGKKISIGVRSPNKVGVEDIVNDLQSNGYTPSLFMVSKKSLEKAWERYKDITFATQSTSGLLDISNDEIEKFTRETKTANDVKQMLKEVMVMKKSHRVTRIVESVLAGAIALGASDIHIEPQEDYVVLRYRIDGVLVEFLQIDKDTQKLTLSRIKLLSGLKLNITGAAQDGRFSIHMGESEVEIRTSVLPGNYGESIVLRILNPDTISLSLEDLGMHPKILETVKRELSRPNGMILNTGPTGSGKTTALYAFLKYLYKPGIKIITIEDPIEYHLPGITQTQIDKKKGYTFLEGLRSALRQDPDVIMVGEIRDEETAATAINAALTGHLVLSTLHTNNAAGTFPRLVDLKINPHTIGSAVRLSMAQRLVRKLRQDSIESYSLDGEYLNLAEKAISSLSKKGFDVSNLDPKKVWRVKEEMKNIEGGGYKGRLGVFEGITVGAELEEFLKDAPGEREIRAFAEQQNIMTIQEDGFLKVLKGITDIEELKRVVDLDYNI
ncbi:hypothetical protein COW81_00170 [Candidatus Campbellbacteria bacterium CG22_combo_CG10-13_8_21_14_all_36_13]|uniref:Bacterial type II secretion system protein E domain-containing protein n=1 Tax=Candidatus Campbellbacteria bacterium CG22_combo_CG10-13_8_21_14_all_36_13 TaxID=1974529 RepID=A0A2H0DZ26_9BACT|nr:MAG: hypothetical protein COW81_00170 [Candidatus Campbellbacteria bacterium CG22_combo_CG10-13_8_21_14_all_36_13]